MCVRVCVTCVCVCVCACVCVGLYVHVFVEGHMIHHCQTMFESLWGAAKDGSLKHITR